MSRPVSEIRRNCRETRDRVLGSSDAASPSRSTAASPTATTGSASAAKDYVIRVPGKDTNLLEIDRFAELAASEMAAGAGVAPKVAAMLEDPPCLVAEFLGARTMTAEELREPGVPRRRRRRPARHPRRRARACPSTFSSFRIVETYAETGAERGATVPHEYEQAHEHARRIEAALAGPRARARSPATTTCSPRTSSTTASGSGSSTGSTPGWATATSTSATSRSTTSSRADDEFALLTAYFDEPPGARRIAALGLMRFMSDFREAMWGVVQSAVSELDFDFTGYAAQALRPAARAGRRPALRALARGGRGARRAADGAAEQGRRPSRRAA